jgi:hypothetical protein
MPKGYPLCWPREDLMGDIGKPIRETDRPEPIKVPAPQPEPVEVPA